MMYYVLQHDNWSRIVEVGMPIPPSEVQYIVFKGTLEQCKDFVYDFRNNLG